MSPTSLIEKFSMKTALDPSWRLNELTDIDWFSISFNWIIIGVTSSLHCNGNIRQVQNLFIIAYIDIEMIIQVNLMVNCQLCLNIFRSIKSANSVIFLCVYLGVDWSNRATFGGQLDLSEVVIRFFFLLKRIQLLMVLISRIYFHDNQGFHATQNNFSNWTS